MALLPREKIHELHRAVLSAGLDRDVLLAGLNRSFVASLPHAPNTSAQILVDLNSLNSVGTLLDGSVPMLEWLQSAVLLTGPRREALVFREASGELTQGASPSPTSEPLSQPMRRATLGALPLQPGPVAPVQGRGSPPRGDGLFVETDAPQGGPNVPETAKQTAPSILAVGVGHYPSGEPHLPDLIQYLNKKLRGSKLNPIVQFSPETRLLASELARQLLLHQPAILHVSLRGSGTGTFQFGQEPTLEGAQGFGALGVEKALGQMFANYGKSIRCVVIDACEDEGQINAITTHVESAIRLRSETSPRAIQLFLAAFYRGLGLGQSVKFAFDLGINELALYNIRDALPELLKGAQDDADKVRLLALSEGR